METLKRVIHPIHREGYIFIIVFAIASIVLGLIWEPLGWFGAILTAWCAYFFRDPERYVPQVEGAIVSPADGVVSHIVKTKLPKELADDTTENAEYTRVSIFLNVFNVHVNRAPIAGKITEIEYHHGKFINASLDKASEHNERNSMLIETADGKKIGVVQIAGFIARRIVCDAKEGDSIQTGERYGIIRFGSRVDVYLPEGVNPQVAVGQIAVGGETLIANLNSTAPEVVVKKI
jgi:phosphatidylserine decarboxylase